MVKLANAIPVYQYLNLVLSCCMVADDESIIKCMDKYIE